MGYSYGINPLTGRSSLACDFCDHVAGEPGTLWVKKIPCPAGYCQAWACCNNCKSAGKHKRASCGFETEELNTNHAGCKARMRPEGMLV